MNWLKSNCKMIICIYIALTIIKLFTASIYQQREEDPTIYFKVQPSISNVFQSSDRHIDFYNDEFQWYRNNQYRELFHANGNVVVALIYFALILLWWVSSAGLILLSFYQLLRKAN